jgi:hypothetical protein
VPRGHRHRRRRSLQRPKSRTAAVRSGQRRFEERVKGLEPHLEGGTSTLARGGAGVRSRDAGRSCVSRGFALHRALHGLAAAAGRRGQSFIGSDDAGELIRQADCVELVRPRELALEGQRCADGRRAGQFTNASECLQNVAVQSGLRHRRARLSATYSSSVRKTAPRKPASSQVSRNRVVHICRPGSPNGSKRSAPSHERSSMASASHSHFDRRQRLQVGLQPGGNAHERARSIAVGPRWMWHMMYSGGASLFRRQVTLTAVAVPFKLRRVRFKDASVRMSNERRENNFCDVDPLRTSGQRPR